MVILIVDDNAAVRRLMRRTLSSPDLVVHECSDGNEALQRYPEILPDITLMDIRMPGMDGIAATRKIAQSFPEAKVVIVTDYDVDEIRKAAFAAGAIDYVLKDNLGDVEAVIRLLVK